MSCTKPPNTTGVYAVINTLTGQCYIGGTKNIRQRWHDHRSELRLNKHVATGLQAAWNAHGEHAIEFRVLVQCDPSAVRATEQEHLDRLRPAYNACPTAGSLRGFKFPAESRARMSAARRGRPGTPHSQETRNQMSLDRKGKKPTPEAIANAAAARVGLKQSPEHSAKISAAHMGKKLSAAHIAKRSATRIANTIARKAQVLH